MYIANLTDEFEAFFDCMIRSWDSLPFEWARSRCGEPFYRALVAGTTPRG